MGQGLNIDVSKILEKQQEIHKPASIPNFDTVDREVWGEGRGV